MRIIPIVDRRRGNQLGRQLSLGAGGKPSTWFPPGGCRANTATERKRTNKRTNQQTKNRQKISQITRHIAILVGGKLEAWWLGGLVAS